MKNKLLFLTLLCCTLMSAVSYAERNEELLDHIVAIVNEDVITKSELDHSLNITKLQMSQENVSLPSATILQEKVLDQLVNKKLQLQVAKQAGITISDEELTSAVQRVADQNHMTIQELYKRINHEGMPTLDYQNEMREQLVLQKLQQQEVINHITITPEEVSVFMRSKIWQDNTSKEYHLEDILIPLSDAPTSEEITAAKNRANVILTKLNHGQRFEALAQANSGNDNALKGGDLGWRKLPEIPTAFAEVAVHLRAKEVSTPIQTPNGFHIIRLAGVRSLETPAAQPDKKQIENLLLQRKFEEAVQNWTSKLRSQAFIEINPSTTNA